MTAHDRELDVSLAPFIDVDDPLVVGLEAARGEADDLHTTLLEIGSAAGYLSQLGRADGSKILRVGPKDTLRRRSACLSRETT